MDFTCSYRDIDDDDVQVQLDVFQEDKHDDDEAVSAAHPAGIDINNHNQLFNALFQKVLVASDIGHMVTI